jgi:hypothetical protein
VVSARLTQRATTSGLSNLGKVSLPEPLGDYVERFDFVPPPPTTRRINCGVVSYGDRLHVTFGRTIREAWVEELFFRRLTSWQIPVSIETNG